MAELPYFLTLRQTIATNAFGSLTHPVPPNEGLKIIGFRHTSTGTFNLTGIRDSTGMQYTNASPTNEVPSTHLQPAIEADIAFTEFETPLELRGGTTFYWDLEDSSGAPNTVIFTFSCIRVTPS